MQPQNHGRQNLAKGGVNKHSGGSDKWGEKPSVAAGGAHQGKYTHMPKKYG
jgi:hypothetical protein